MAATPAARLVSCSGSPVGPGGEPEVRLEREPLLAAVLDCSLQGLPPLLDGSINVTVPVATGSTADDRWVRDHLVAAMPFARDEQWVDRCAGGQCQSKRSGWDIGQ